MKTFSPLIGTKLVQDLVDKGLLPNGTTRFVIDSGHPGEPVRIFWSGWADVELIKQLMENLEPRDAT